MLNIEEFFKKSKFINHLNFSGMNFTKEQILHLLELARTLKYLLGIHLSDNGIVKNMMGEASDKEFYYDCLDPFRISELDLLYINRSMIKEVKIRPEEQEKYDILDIDYAKFLKPYFFFDIDKLKENKECCEINARKLYKDSILLGKERKIIDHYKLMN